MHLAGNATGALYHCLLTLPSAKNMNNIKSFEVSLLFRFKLAAGPTHVDHPEKQIRYPGCI